MQKQAQKVVHPQLVLARTHTSRRGLRPTVVPKMTLATRGRGAPPGRGTRTARNTTRGSRKPPPKARPRAPERQRSHYVGARGCSTQTSTPSHPGSGPAAGELLGGADPTRRPSATQPGSPPRRTAPTSRPCDGASEREDSGRRPPRDRPTSAPGLRTCWPSRRCSGSPPRSCQ